MNSVMHAIRTLWTWLALAALATGCATVRQAREAQNPARVPPGERTVTPAEAGLGTNTLLTMEAALAVADAYHPTVVQARQNLAAAARQFDQTKAARRPSVDASAGYSRSTANIKGAPESHTSGGSYSAGLSADWTVYDFGRSPAAVREAFARLRAAEQSLRAARLDVSYGVRTAWYELNQAEELLRVAEETVRQFEVHLDQARSLVEIGKRIRYDITKAEVDLGNARLDLINARNAVITARATVNRRLGLAEDPGYRLAETGSEETTPPFEEAMTVARERQPQLRALRENVLAASAAVDRAVAELYPSLTLSAEYAWAGSAFPLIWNWAISPRGVWNVFSGGGRVAAVDEAVALLRAARARAADGEQQISLDLSQAYAQLDGARQRRDLADLIVRQARESLDLVSERYRLGQASAVERTDAETALTKARADQVKARFDCYAAVALIRFTMGEDGL